MHIRLYTYISHFFLARLPKWNTKVLFDLHFSLQSFFVSPFFHLLTRMVVDMITEDPARKLKKSNPISLRH